MNMSLNESFDKQFSRFVEENEEDVSKKVHPLEVALNERAEKLIKDGETNIKAYEVAFQDVIEKLYPGKSWWEVTNSNIFWILFQTKSVQKAIEDIIENLNDEYKDNYVEQGSLKIGDFNFDEIDESLNEDHTVRNYKGYDIDFNNDDIENCEDEVCKLTYDIIKDGKVIKTIDGLRNARAYIDELTKNTIDIDKIYKFMNKCHGMDFAEISDTQIEFRTPSGWVNIMYKEGSHPFYTLYYIKHDEDNEDTTSSPTLNNLLTSTLARDICFDAEEVLNSFNESLNKNPLEDIESENIMEFPNGDYVYVGFENGKLYAGSATNTGIIHEYEMDYDEDDTLDGNLNNFYDMIIEKNSDLMNESCKGRKSRKSKLNESTSNFSFENICLVVTDEDFEIGNYPEYDTKEDYGSRSYPSYPLIDYNDKLDYYRIVLNPGYYSDACIDYIEIGNHLYDEYDRDGILHEMNYLYYFDNSKWYNNKDQEVSKDEVKKEIFKVFKMFGYDLTEKDANTIMDDYYTDARSAFFIMDRDDNEYDFIKNEKDKELNIVLDRIKDIKKEYGFKEYDVSARFSNGEVWYSPVNESCKGKKIEKKINEEYGEYRGEYFCDEIADQLSSLDDYGWVDNTKWSLTINGIDSGDFDCTKLLDWMLDDISRPVKDGFLDFNGLDEIFYVDLFDDFDDFDNLKHDLFLLNFHEDEIDSFISKIKEHQKSKNKDIADEYIETWIDYDTNFDVDDYYKNQDKDIEESYRIKINERNLTKAERHNKRMNDVFDNYKKTQSKYADFLKSKGISDDEIKELTDDSGLHGNSLAKKAKEMGFYDESYKINEAPIYGLEPQYDARKSFYGKAQVDTGDKGDQNKLYSYGTLVAEIKDGKPVVHGTFSQTTLRHIKDWLKQNGFKAESGRQIMNDYGVVNESRINEKGLFGKKKKNVEQENHDDIKVGDFTIFYNDVNDRWLVMNKDNQVYEKSFKTSGAAEFWAEQNGNDWTNVWESLKEDTIKQGNAWVNKGKEGTHGKFRTKKQADAQRKAMFAQGYKESCKRRK